VFSDAVTTYIPVSISQECSLHQPITDDIAMWRDLGIDLVGLISPKLEPVDWDVRLVTDAGLQVCSIGAELANLDRAFEFAAAVGADSVWTCTGPLGARTWEQAADDFCQSIAPAVRRAADLGVELAIEPTNPLRCDVSFAFTMRDTFDLARAAGVGVALDLAMCWYERGLEQLVRDNVDLLTLVQINDYKIGTVRTPDRSVLGDGDIPLQRLIGMFLDAGYSRPFDLEILGPKIDAEGYPSAIRRSIEEFSGILGRLGV
jgi:sugar phosphate isomerase/epimerase